MDKLAVNASDYGLEEKKANELTIGLNVVVSERELLINEFDEVSKLELTEENVSKFKELRLKIVKNRTQGINKWHKASKEYFLTGGKFVDAIKNKEIHINESMETVLMNGEKHFENLEKERLANLQIERVGIISEYLENASEIDLSTMDDDIFEAYLSIKKQAYLDKVKAELDAEKEREAVRKAEKVRLEKQRLENERLKKEAAKREAEIEAERKEAKDKADAIELKAKQEAEKERKAQAKKDAELKKELKAIKDLSDARIEEANRLKKIADDKLKAKELAETKAKADELDRVEAELNKGDAEKVKDLINDLESLMKKYSFKSVKNKKMYSNVGTLLSKVINHINK